MSNTTRSTLANTIIAGMFLSMIAGIASWNVTAIRDNTKAVRSNTDMVYENRQKNQLQHTELAGLIIGINYDIVKLNEDCNDNKVELGKCKALHFKD